MSVTPALFTELKPLRHSQLTCLSWNIDWFISLDESQRMVRLEHDFSLFGHLESLSLKFDLHFLP